MNDSYSTKDLRRGARCAILICDRNIQYHPDELDNTDRIDDRVISLKRIEGGCSRLNPFIEEITDLLAPLTDLSAGEIVPLLEIPPDEKMGDYALIFL